MLVSSHHWCHNTGYFKTIIFYFSKVLQNTLSFTGRRAFSGDSTLILFDKINMFSASLSMLLFLFSFPFCLTLVIVDLMMLYFPSVLLEKGSQIQTLSWSYPSSKSSSEHYPKLCSFSEPRCKEHNLLPICCHLRGIQWQRPKAAWLQKSSSIAQYSVSTEGRGGKTNFLLHRSQVITHY